MLLFAVVTYLRTEFESEFDIDFLHFTSPKKKKGGRRESPMMDRPLYTTSTM